MFHKYHPPPGSKPGTLVLNGHTEPPVVRVMKYRADALTEHENVTVDEVAKLLEPGTVCWVDVQGLGDEATLQALAQLFNIHVLALEDVVNVPQRPKVERFDQHTFCVLRMLRIIDDDLDAEQVSLFLGEHFVLTFQQRSGDVFDRVRRRIRQGGPILRSAGSGYLAYALLDAVIDGYYPVLEWFGETLESLEEAVTDNPQADVLRDLHQVKRDLLTMRRAVWPLREAVSSLIHDENPLFTSQVRVHLRDCYDHAVQVIDGVETSRELAAGLMDVFLSSLANRQNEVMKALTIMASIFIPLTFLAGIYGMNFQHMPELHTRWGYPILLAVMVVVAVGMVLFFRVRGWLPSARRGRSRDDDA